MTDGTHTGRRRTRVRAAWVAAAVLAGTGAVWHNVLNRWKPEIPRVWDEAAGPCRWRAWRLHAPGSATRAIRGHEFGLTLTAEERAQLIAFLRTL